MRIKYYGNNRNEKFKFSKRGFMRFTVVMVVFFIYTGRVFREEVLSFYGIF